MRNHTKQLLWDNYAVAIARKLLLIEIQRLEKLDTDNELTVSEKANLNKLYEMFGEMTTNR